MILLTFFRNFFDLRKSWGGSSEALALFAHKVIGESMLINNAFDESGMPENGERLGPGSAKKRKKSANAAHSRRCAFSDFCMANRALRGF